MTRAYPTMNQIYSKMDSIYNKLHHITKSNTNEQQTRYHIANHTRLKMCDSENE